MRTRSNRQKQPKKCQQNRGNNLRIESNCPNGSDKNGKELGQSNTTLPFQKYTNCFSPLKQFGTTNQANLKVSKKKRLLINIKKNRKITNRTTRNKIYRKYPFLKELSLCNSKNKMELIFTKMPEKWKSFFKFYMTNCFIKHLFIRQIKNCSGLFKKRELFFKAIDDPKIIRSNIHFGNNLIKNFCKGICNFVAMFFKELRRNHLIPK